MIKIFVQHLKRFKEKFMPKYIPKVGTFLTISLPGEVLRAEVQKVVTSDAIVVTIATEPLAKSHSYKFGQVIACRRHVGIFGEDWIVAEKGYASVEEIAKQEKDNAIKERVEPKDDKLEHKPARKRRKAAKASGGNRSKPVKKITKKK
jgi:hypothetical protein